MRLEGQAQLEDAEAQQDQADGADQGEDEVAEIGDDLERIVGDRGGRSEGGAARDGHCQHQAAEERGDLSGAALNLLGVVEVVLHFQKSPSYFQ